MAGTSAGAKKGWLHRKAGVGFRIPSGPKGRRNMASFLRTLRGQNPVKTTFKKRNLSVIRDYKGVLRALKPTNAWVNFPKGGR